MLSTRQRPKIDEYDEYLFIVLHVPHFNKMQAPPGRRRAERVRAEGT